MILSHFTVARLRVHGVGRSYRKSRKFNVRLILIGYISFGDMTDVVSQRSMKLIS